MTTRKLQNIFNNKNIQIIEGTEGNGMSVSGVRIGDYPRKIRRVRMDKFESKLRQNFFDYHLRGCTPGNIESNIMCDKNKERLIQWILRATQK